jgi:MoaA/NifB/PqqE/SkfB family radical SAM enzyme
VKTEDHIGVICERCSSSVFVPLANDAAIASRPCSYCGETVYASRYRRLDIGLSEVCNLQCNMCRRPQEKASMPFESVARILVEGRLIGVTTISFSGGEPFAHPRFRDILEVALPLGLDIELVTNGTLVRPADIPLLERLRCVTVSIDGVREVHDYIRGGAGAWDKTMETVRRLASSKAKWGTNTVIQTHNADILFETWRAIRSAGRPSYVGFTHVEVVPETAHLQPSPEQAKRIKAQLAQIRAECIGSVHFNDDQIVTTLYDVFADKSRRYRPLGGCRIPQTFLGVSSYGVFPCWHQGRYIRSHALIEALQSDLCREIVAEGLERRCIGCNAANYSWSEEWVEGIAKAAAVDQSSEGVVYLSAAEREAGALLSERRTLPLLERIANGRL